VTLNGGNAIATPGLVRRAFQKQWRAAPQPSPWAPVEPQATGQKEPAVSLMNDVLKPYFVLACVAFFVGFASYLALGRMLAPPTLATDDWQASISAPAVPDQPLARAKHI
jgi:hypothetical protein